MLPTLTVISFIVALAWLQQQFLNHLIEVDRKALEAARPHRRSSPQPKQH